MVRNLPCVGTILVAMAALYAAMNSGSLGFPAVTSPLSSAQLTHRHNTAHVKLGQRQGDLLKLTWNAYDGTHIRLKQSKTGKRVTILVAAPLKRMLDATPRTSPLILMNGDIPWTAYAFRSAWMRACRKVGITDETFSDLRGIFVTRAAVAGSTDPRIAGVTGTPCAT